MTPYEHGRAAGFRATAFLEACPYDSHTLEAREWRQGFLDIRTALDSYRSTEPVSEVIRS
jgi:hypothetical protein